MFLVNASAGVVAAELVLFPIWASFLVSDRYNSTTSGTRRTDFVPAKNLEGNGGGGGANFGGVVGGGGVDGGGTLIEPGLGGGGFGTFIDLSLPTSDS